MNMNVGITAYDPDHFAITVNRDGLWGLEDFLATVARETEGWTAIRAEFLLQKVSDALKATHDAYHNPPVAPERGEELPRSEENPDGVS